VGTAAMAQLEQKDYKKNQEEWDKKIKEELKLTSDQVVKYDENFRTLRNKIYLITLIPTISRKPFSRKDIFPKSSAHIMITLPKVFGIMSDIG
jgi:ppGpp synthetase/RelA/SpoT-type nucleotidyltranferase